MIEKMTWTDLDFDLMGWHDCSLYGIGFEAINYKLIFDIDYIFKWELQGELYNFWTAPCTLIFENCSNIKIELDFGLTNQLIISDIKRGEKKKSPNGKLDLRTYRIITDVGFIEFSSSSFLQSIRKDIKISESQDYGFLERDGITLNSS